jgi:hypothetical protein
MSHKRMDNEQITQSRQEGASIKTRAVRVERITLEDGREGWKYSDGSIRDEAGRLMVRNEHAAPIITAETSPAYHRARWEKFREASAPAFVRKMRAKHPTEDIKDEYDAFGAFVADQAGKVNAAERPHPQGAEFVAKAIGAFPLAKEAEQAENPPVSGILATGAAAVQLAAVLGEALRLVSSHNITYDNQHGADVVDAQASDPGPTPPAEDAPPEPDESERE